MHVTFHLHHSAALLQCHRGSHTHDWTWFDSGTVVSAALTTWTWESKGHLWPCFWQKLKKSLISPSLAIYKMQFLPSRQERIISGQIVPLFSLHRSALYSSFQTKAASEVCCVFGKVLHASSEMRTIPGILCWPKFKAASLPSILFCGHNA